MFQNSKLNPWKLILVTLGLAFTACTQGQQGAGSGTAGGEAAGGGEQPKVTVSGVPSMDGCEKPENLDNILCQWVATEMKVTVGGKQEALINFIYDDKGRPIYLTGFDKDGKKELIAGLFFSDSGVIKIVNFSGANPPGSEKYIYEQTTSTQYNADGTIHDMNLEVKNNGALSSTSSTTYNYLPQSSLIMKIKTDRDAAGTTTNACNISITTDSTSGKYNSIDEQCGLPGMMGGNLKTRSISTLGYDTDSGKLISVVTQSQDCGVTPCAAQLDPTSDTTIQMSYEGGHLSLYSISQEGSVDYSTNPPTVSKIGVLPNPDTVIECGFTYDLQTQAKVAMWNPFQLFLLLYPQQQFQMDFGDKDYFATFSCSIGGKEQIKMEIKWARLWEVLPGGKPPGV